MSGEVRVQAMLQIVTGNTFYQSRPTGFVGNLVGHAGTGSVGATGPAPGAFPIQTAGTIPNLGALDQPGFARISNIDNKGAYDFGLYIGGVFYPFLEVEAGQSYVLKFSKNLNKLLLKFYPQEVQTIEALVEAFTR
jgi:hypothetical protein